MNCGRCTFPMNEFGMTYMCTGCTVIIDLLRGICRFRVGPYQIQLIDTFIEADIPFDRSIVSKGLKQIKLIQELSLTVTEQELDEIWKKIRGEGNE